MGVTRRLLARRTGGGCAAFFAASSLASADDGVPHRADDHQHEAENIQARHRPVHAQHAERYYQDLAMHEQGERRGRGTDCLSFAKSQEDWSKGLILCNASHTHGRC